LPLNSALDRSRCSYDAETRCRSSSKPNPFSAFLQSIVGDGNVDSLSSRPRVSVIPPNPNRQK
jgi:hypothetical protein